MVKTNNNPWISLAFGYIILFVFAILLNYFSFYDGSSNFFSWGPPVNILNKTIENQIEFYLFLSMFFIHQMTNTWISEVTYPWILNNIQDHKQEYMPEKMNKIKCLLLVNLNTIYSLLDIIFIVSSVSQISFMISLILSNMISVTIVNYKYLNGKKKYEIEIEGEEEEDSLV